MKDKTVSLGQITREEFMGEVGRLFPDQGQALLVFNVDSPAPHQHDVQMLTHRCELSQAIAVMVYPSSVMIEQRVKGAEKVQDAINLLFGREHSRTEH